MTTAATQPPLTGRLIREHILRESRRANVGHIGSALSIADILAALYGRILRIARTDDPERDRFVLSKGHAALALYAALTLRGWLTPAELATYCGEDSLLGVHPERELPGVDFCTGSLGQGLSMAVGSALAARKSGSARRVFALVSDAELNEGSIWEAVMFAAQHRLSNLTVFVDANGQQALGYTKDVIAIGNAVERFAAFGWYAREVDGHDVDAIEAAVAAAGEDPRPRALVARTVFGRGVSYMESLIKWHYMPMSAEEYERALAEVART
jgi:transketolase